MKINIFFISSDFKSKNLFQLKFLAKVRVVWLRAYGVGVGHRCPPTLLPPPVLQLRCAPRSDTVPTLPAVWPWHAGSGTIFWFGSLSASVFPQTRRALQLWGNFWPRILSPAAAVDLWWRGCVGYGRTGVSARCTLRAVAAKTCQPGWSGVEELGLR